jgi:hypothetical protein
MPLLCFRTESKVKKQAISNGADKTVNDESVSKSLVGENGNGKEEVDENTSKAEPEDGTKNSKKAQLHKTCSIFFRNIPTSAKLADIENVGASMLLLLF